MSQLVKSKSQMGGTLVSAFYERSEEDNDNGEILSIAHAVEVTPEYQPLKPYSKEFRNRVDDISKRRQFKDEAFNGKNTIEDMYSKRVVQKDSADVDHTYSIKKAYGDASIFNTEADIKKAVNQKQNYKITDSSFNRSKGAKTNTEYLIKELQHGNDKNITVSEARKLIVEGTKAKAIVEGSLKIQAIQHAGEIGAQAAKEGAKYALAISSVQNLSEVAKGELELSEAVENIVVDTAKVGATSAATGLFKFSAEAMVKQTADKLKNEAIKKSLEKFSTTGGIGAAVTLFVATGKTVGKYLSGELDEKEMIIELGEQGSGLAASMGGSMLGKGIGFLIGNTILPGLGGGVGYFVGEFIGSMAGYMIGSQIYHTVIDFFGSTNACPKDIRILIDQMATDLEQARVQLDKILSDIRIAEEDKISNAMCSLYQGVANSNYEQIDNSLTSICDLFGRKLAFPDQNSFDTFILDDSLCMPTL